MLESGELYIYGLEKSDQHSSFRCRTRHRLSSVDQMSSNAASVTVAGCLPFLSLSLSLHLPVFAFATSQWLISLSKNQLRTNIPILNSSCLHLRSFSSSHSAPSSSSPSIQLNYIRCLLFGIWWFQCRVSFDRFVWCWNRRNLHDRIYRPIPFIH